MTGLSLTRSDETCPDGQAAVRRSFDEGHLCLAVAGVGLAALVALATLRLSREGIAGARGLAFLKLLGLFHQPLLGIFSSVKETRVYVPGFGVDLCG